MPRYSYSCEKCECFYTIIHPMGEVTEEECEECEEPLARVFTIPRNYKLKETKRKTGDVVKSYIEDSREELKDQIEELKEKR